MGYSREGGFQLDLHQHVLWDCVYPEADRPFWERAEPYVFHGVKTATLSAGDDLLHACVHAARYNDFPPVRWAADAVHILRSAGPSLEWDRLVALAEQLRLSLSLHAALSYLANDLEAPIPAQILKALETMPVSPAERRFYRLKVSRPGVLKNFPLIWYQYTRLAHGTGERVSLSGYLRYIQHAWNLPRGRDIPAYGWRRLKQELARRRGQPAAT
jgi:hypothetical protein